MRVEVREPVDHGLRLLRGRGVVEPDERLAPLTRSAGSENRGAPVGHRMAGGHARRSERWRRVPQNLRRRQSAGRWRLTSAEEVEGGCGGQGAANANVEGRSGQVSSSMATWELLAAGSCCRGFRLSQLATRRRQGADAEVAGGSRCRTGAAVTIDQSQHQLCDCRRSSSLNPNADREAWSSAGEDRVPSSGAAPPGVAENH